MHTHVYGARALHNGNGQSKPGSRGARCAGGRGTKGGEINTLSGTIAAHVSRATRPLRHKFRGFNKDSWLPLAERSLPRCSTTTVHGLARRKDGERTSSLTRAILPPHRRRVFRNPSRCETFATETVARFAFRKGILRSRLTRIET